MTIINKIINGDSLQIMKTLPENSIDLIFTDPSYPKEYLYLYKGLADITPKILKEHASLLLIVPQIHLEEIIRYFYNKLKYRWICCMNQENDSHARIRIGIEVFWKPILWYSKGTCYVKGTWKRQNFIHDMIKIEKRNKQYHKWQQDESWCEYYIEKLTKEGDLILDPFFGSGTVGAVCKKLNRNFIGIELDSNYCKIASKRLNCEIIKFSNDIKIDIPKIEYNTNICPKCGSKLFNGKHGYYCTKIGCNYSSTKEDNKSTKGL